jgi:hypothetical protein
VVGSGTAIAPVVATPKTAPTATHMALTLGR